MDIDALILSRNLIKKKIRHYRDEMMYNKDDTNFVNARKEKIYKLRVISSEMLILIKQLKDYTL
jgi:hypothetical protein